MYVLNKTDIFIFYVPCIKHFLASDLMNICLGNALVVRRQEAQTFSLCYYMIATTNESLALNI